MQKDIQDYTTKLEFSLGIMHNQVSYAETKNASMIALSGVLLFGILSNIENIKKILISVAVDIVPSFDEKYFSFSILFASIHILISLLLSIYSFLPSVTNKLIEIKGKEYRNLLFFLSNTNFTTCEDLKRFYQTKYKNINKYQEDISNQILNLSKIANRKYRLFTYALYSLLYMLITIPILIIILYFL